MRVELYADNTLPLPLEHLAKKLSELCHTIDFVKGSEPFRLRETYISYPTTYQNLPQNLKDSLKSNDLSILATAVRYDNNYFFESSGNAIIVSFSDWNLLTDLPVSNGLIYFTAALLMSHFDFRKQHDENIGCINDFWWDKRGVDLGMRAAFICSECRTSTSSLPPELSDIDTLLDVVSRASRTGRDVMDLVSLSKESEEEKFDVFLCHNSQDKPAIREIKSAFQEGGLRTWLDEDQLPMGLPWQQELEKQIGKIRSAAVFVGDSGFGPWQNVEMRAFLSEFVRRGCPVIPVILPTATSVPELPLFLKAMTWVDLRKDYPQGLTRMIDAIKGYRSR